MGQLMKKLRFAVIGTGFWSTLQIPAWFETDGVELVALYNRTAEKAKKAAKNYGNPKVYENPEEMFKKEELDFVDIITEVPAHEKFVLMAAKYKVPVICQKPMSFSYNSCLKMINECKKAGIPFFIHENYRWMKHFRNLKKILLENLIGEIVFAELYMENFGESAFTAQPFLSELPHYIFMDMGPHIYDIARFLFGEPETIFTNALKVYDYIEGESVMSSQLKYDKMICTATVKQFITRYAHVEGKYGSIILNKDNTIDIQSEHETGRRIFEKLDFPFWAEHVKDYVSPYEVQMIVDCNKSFYEAFQSGKEPETTAENNLKSMNLVFKSIESFIKNKEIKI